MPTVKTIATEVSVILGLLDENWTTVCYDELPEELKETFTEDRYKAGPWILRSTAGKAPFFKSGMKGDIIFIRCIANI